MLFEHEYVTGSGKTTVVHTTTVVAVSSSHPQWRRAAIGTLASAMIERAPLLRRRVLRTAPDVFETGNADVDKHWIAQGAQDTLRTFLTAHVCAMLLDSPMGEAWHIGHGYVSCAYRGGLRADGIGRLLDRVQTALG